MKWFAISTAILSVAYMGLGYAAYVCLKLTSEAPPLLTVMKAFLLSQPAKYVPGGVWLFPGRVYLYHRYAHFPVEKGMVGIFWEVVLLVATASLVSLGTSMDVLRETSLLPLMVLILITAVVAVVIGLNIPLFYQSDRFRQIINRAHLSARVKLILFSEYRPKYGIFALMIFGISWLVIGFAFYLQVISIYSDAGALWRYFGIFSSAWAFGFVTLITPSGFGVRETILILMLGTALPAPYPLLVAMTSRVWWMLAEIVVILIGLIVPARSET